MRIKSIISILLLLTAPAYAQTGTAKNLTQLNTEVNSQLPDQNVGTITPYVLRQLELDFAASISFIGHGTFVCTSGGTIIITNTNAAITDVVSISLNTIGGSFTAAPFVNAITAANSFSTKCATSDTSTYNYAIIKNSP